MTRSASYRNRQNKNIKQKFDEEKNRRLNLGCADCPDNSIWKFDSRVLTFDHVPERGPKKYNIGVLGRTGISLGARLAELDKCDVVCANHHSIREFNRKRTQQCTESTRSASVDTA